MRVFVTGATGFVGSAVVGELVGASHQVVGLARSDPGAEALRAMGATAHRGDLTNLDSLRSGAAACDAVIHAGFIHDFSKFKESCEVDRRAIETLGAVLAGSDRLLIVTSGTALLPPGQLATEDTEAPSDHGMPRVSEQAAFAAASRSARISVVRLPPSVHGDGDHGFIPLLIGMARDKNEASFVGDGSNRWPAVHRLDAARAYRLVLEKGEAGKRYHAVAEGGVPFREIAAVIGRRLGVTVVGRAPEQAAEYFGWFTGFASIDNLVSSQTTRDALGWAPTGPDLIADIDRPVYFEG